MSDNWIEVLRTGTHTSSSGQKVTIDDGYLQRLSQGYDTSRHEAPLVLGHPQDNSPALGWTEALKVEGGKLLAKVKPVDSLRQWVRDGLYRKVSASIYQDLDGRGPYLRHIGFLGATPPSIKGLSPVQFKDGAAVTFEFEERSDEMDESKFRQMLLEFKESIVSTVNSALGRKPADAGGGDVSKQIAEAVDAATAKVTKDFSEQIKGLETKVGDQAKQLTAAEESTRRASIHSFADQLKAKGQWVPAFEKMHLVEFMEALPSGEGAPVIEFSETKTEDGKEVTTTTKQSPLQFFQEFLEKLPKIVEFGELTGGVKGGQSSSKVIDFTPGDRRATNIDLAERASAIADEKKIEYGEALEMARRESA